MVFYIARRLLQAIPTLIGVSLISFILLKLAPGDPIQIMTFSPNISEEDRAALRTYYGTDQPIVNQYISWLTGFDLRRDEYTPPINNIECTYWGSINLTFCDTHGGVIRGDFGKSFTTHQPVLNRIQERVPATLQLTSLGLLLGIMLGLPLGIIGAVFHRTIVDDLTRFVAVIGNAIPQFWIGLMLIYFFGVYLKWLPTGGRQSITSNGSFPLIDYIQHIIMPASVLAMGWIAVLSRFLRSELLDIIHMQYILMAHAKGVPPKRIWFSHAMRNALIPLATILGPAITRLLVGTVVIETIFSWPGIGRLAFDSALQRDYPMVLGIAMITSLLAIGGNMISDILYGIIDPRVRKTTR